jgi:hypothetical protein
MATCPIGAPMPLMSILLTSTFSCPSAAPAARQPISKGKTRFMGFSREKAVGPPEKSGVL